MINIENKSAQNSNQQSIQSTEEFQLSDEDIKFETEREAAFLKRIEKRLKKKHEEIIAILKTITPENERMS